MTTENWPELQQGQPLRCKDGAARLVPVHLFTVDVDILAFPPFSFITPVMALLLCLKSKAYFS